MDNQFTEAWYSPKGNKLYCFYVKNPPKRIALWDREKSQFHEFKDGACYCYCAYVLRIPRYSDFLSPILTNAGIFLRGLKLSGESTSY